MRLTKMQSRHIQTSFNAVSDILSILPRVLIVLNLTLIASCKEPSNDCGSENGNWRALQSNVQNSKDSHPHSLIKGALLGSTFKSFEELKTVVQIEYNDEIPMVRVSHESDGIKVCSTLKPGVNEGDFRKARDGDLFDKLSLAIRSPFAAWNQDDLVRVFILARRKPNIFGESDVAFFNIAEANICNMDASNYGTASIRDLSEKGYINTINHITAQAIITTCFSEEMADYIADVHERFYHPELIRGDFTPDQVNDLDEGPLDNYIDMINNEWGQELGKALKSKHDINSSTVWTPSLLAAYLNSTQDYYSYAFNVDFEPFSEKDSIVVNYARKMAHVMEDVSEIKGQLGSVKK